MHIRHVRTHDEFVACLELQATRVRAGSLLSSVIGRS